MLRTRIIPTLLLHNASLVKTERFGRFQYIGDPCNTVRIFNELEVDELAFVDITATREGRTPNLSVLRDIADECFMPLSYGGGISALKHARSVFQTGFEKVILNSHAEANPTLITQIADAYGAQAVVVSIDVRKNLFGKYRVATQGGRKRTRRDPVEWAKEAEQRGAGEILLTSIDREGTWQGQDIELVASVTQAVSIPVIAQGGSGTIGHIADVVKRGGASAVAVGSMVVFQKKGMGVLVNFPDAQKLRQALA